MISFQTLLNERYNRIQLVANRNQTQRWYDAVDRLKRASIKPKPWWFPVTAIDFFRSKLRNKLTKTVAISIAPNTIFLMDEYWDQSFVSQCSTLIHEHTHLKQWDNGELHYLNYLIKPEILEYEANLEEENFRKVFYK